MEVTRETGQVDVTRETGQVDRCEVSWRGPGLSRLSEGGLRSCSGQTSALTSLQHQRSEQKSEK